MKTFSDLSDLEGVERTQDIEYIKFLRTHMKIIGFWPLKEVGEVETKKVFYERCYIYLLESILYLLGILYIKINVGKLPLIEMGHTYITVLINTVAVSRLPLTFMKTNRTLCGDFITTIHLFNYKDKSDYSMKMHKFIHKISHFLCKYVITMMFIGIVLFNVAPIFMNISNGAFQNSGSKNVTYEHSVYYALPFDYTTNFNGFFAVFCFNWYISYICSSCLCTFDLFLCLIMLHLWGHLKILIYNIDHFPKPMSVEESENFNGRKSKLSSVMFSEEELRNVSVLLRENIVHHKLIINFSSRISDTFGFSLMIYYGIHQIVECILLLECSHMNYKSLTRYGPLTFVFFQQLIQMSTLFELLGSLSDKLADAVYSLPWEYMDTKNRNIVLIWLKRSQLLMSVKAGGMVVIGVQTMFSIFKTSCSYYLLLRSLESGNI